MITDSDLIFSTVRLHFDREARRPHKEDCKHMTMCADQVGQGGGGKKEIKRAQKHEQNVSMAGNQVFYNNLSSIVMQAVVQNYSILDCVVVIDLCKTPPEINVKIASDFLYNNGMYTDPENNAHTKRIIDRNRGNGSLTVACISHGEFGNNDEANAVLLKTFPGQVAFRGSWPAMQEHMKQSYGVDELEDLRRRPSEIERVLKNLTIANTQKR